MKAHDCLLCKIIPPNHRITDTNTDTNTRQRSISSPAADWISEHRGSGPVVAEKFLGGSNWASTYVYTTEGGER